VTSHVGLVLARDGAQIRLAQVPEQKQKQVPKLLNKKSQDLERK
jgi:hypothetical protein